MSTTFSGTTSTSKLCRKISDVTGGACLLSFSRGKDSLATWLYLRNFFDKITPIYQVLVPGLSFVEKSLTYYEEFFDTEIVRCYYGAALEPIVEWFYQGPYDIVDIAELGLRWWEYEATDNTYREYHGIEEMPVAKGITINDSLARRLWLNRQTPSNRGIDKDRGWFFPIYDWRIGEILEYIESSGCCLPDDYTIGSGSFLYPSLDHLYGVRRKYPDDFEKLKDAYPLIEMVIARNEFRKLHWGLPNEVTNPGIFSA